MLSFIGVENKIGSYFTFHKGVKMKKAVMYFRVSTKKQGRSGLGLEAQRRDCISFCLSHGVEMIGSFTEVASGGDDERPQLHAAIAAAQKAGASVLVSKLCRLSRDVHFISGLMKHRIDFVVANLGLNTPTLMLHIIAAVMQEERRRIGVATSKGMLASSKPLGAQLPKTAEAVRKAAIKRGNTTLERVAPYISEAMEQGITSNRKIAEYLTSQGVRSPRGKAFNHATVRNLRKKMMERITA